MSSPKREAKIRPLIMCGGAGTRLWPASRESLPKQFVPLLGRRSSFQETVLRLQGEGFAACPLIVASAAHRHLIDRQLQEIGAKADLLLEPCRRDSGPASVAGSLWIARHAPGSAVLVVAADHLIRDDAAFRAAVLSALPAAAAGRIVAFGIVPEYAATEYGYIEPGGKAEAGAFAVASFTEKPDAETASRYIGSGYLWNSGNFLFEPETLLGEYRSFHPATVDAVETALDRGVAEHGALLLDRPSMERAEKTSVDYAVMERTKRAAVLALSCGWSDIGSWDALWPLRSKDKHGNVSIGDAQLFDAKNCYVSAAGPLTTLLGVSDLIVVAEPDAILVADRRRGAEVKQIVETLRAQGRREADSHSTVYRPWGWYQITDSDSRFEARRIVVDASAALPVQTHDNHAVHWIVLKGQARAEIGHDAKILAANAHVLAPPMVPHGLANIGKGPVELIEIRTQAIPPGLTE
jgi:mannose-1-phosphate guanylyltransferase/mannose-6-phosphate isomerase